MSHNPSLIDVAPITPLLDLPDLHMSPCRMNLIATLPKRSVNQSVFLSNELSSDQSLDQDGDWLFVAHRTGIAVYSIPLSGVLASKQTTSQSTNRSLNRSMHRSFNQSDEDEIFHQPIDQPIAHLQVGGVINRLMAGYYDKEPIIVAVDMLGNINVFFAVNIAINQSINQSIKQANNRTNNQTINHANHSIDPVVGECVIDPTDPSAWSLSISPYQSINPMIIVGTNNHRVFIVKLDVINQSIKSINPDHGIHGHNLPCLSINQSNTLIASASIDERVRVIRINHDVINQSDNQPNNQTINQTINQSINQSNDQSSNESTSLQIVNNYRSVGQWGWAVMWFQSRYAQSVDQSINQSINQSNNQSFDWDIQDYVRSMGETFAQQLIDGNESINQSNDQSTNPTIDEESRSVSARRARMIQPNRTHIQPINQSNNQSINQPSNQTINQPNNPRVPEFTDDELVQLMQGDTRQFLGRLIQGGPVNGPLNQVDLNVTNRLLERLLEGVTGHVSMEQLINRSDNNDEDMAIVDGHIESDASDDDSFVPSDDQSDEFSDDQLDDDDSMQLSDFYVDEPPFTVLINQSNNQTINRPISQSLAHSTKHQLLGIDQSINQSINCCHSHSFLSSDLLIYCTDHSIRLLDSSLQLLDHVDHHSLQLPFNRLVNQSLIRHREAFPRLQFVESIEQLSIVIVGSAAACRLIVYQIVRLDSSKNQSNNQLDNQSNEQSNNQSVDHSNTQSNNQSNNQNESTYKLVPVTLIGEIRNEPIVGVSVIRKCSSQCSTYQSINQSISHQSIDQSTHQQCLCADIDCMSKGCSWLVHILYLDSKLITYSINQSINQSVLGPGRTDQQYDLSTIVTF